MKFFTVIVVVACFGASFGFFLDSLPTLPQLPTFSCSKDVDCGPSRCCLRLFSSIFARGICLGQVSSKFDICKLKFTCTNDADCGAKKCCFKPTSYLSRGVCLPQISAKFDICKPKIIPAKCTQDSECNSATQCCMSYTIGFGKLSLTRGRCLPKIGKNFPCGTKVYPCGCSAGLQCKVTTIFKVESGRDQNGQLKPVVTYSTRMCVPVDDVVKPDVVVVKPEGSDNQRRFLGFLPTIPTLPKLPTILRNCSNNADCGVKRGCTSAIPLIGRICVPLIPNNLICNSYTEGCCRDGHECRVSTKITLPFGREFIIKRCLSINTPVALEELEATED